jgi:hypothetical protein
MKTKLLVLAAICVVAAGCKSPVSKQATQDIAAPINCTTAEGDLRSLQAEKAHVGKEIANGVSAIVPIGLVVGVATKTEKARLEVGTGEYNKMIDKKIAEIKSTCGIK